MKIVVVVNRIRAVEILRNRVLVRYSLLHTKIEAYSVAAPRQGSLSLTSCGGVDLFTLNRITPQLYEFFA